jgi:hypothetical protein
MEEISLFHFRDMKTDFSLTTVQKETISILITWNVWQMISVGYMNLLNQKQYNNIQTGRLTVGRKLTATAINIILILEETS